MSKLPNKTLPVAVDEAYSKELQEYVTYSTEVFKGLKDWGDILVAWHYYPKISPYAFEDALIALVRSGALAINAVEYDLDGLYEAVTGEKANIERLVGIINVFSDFVA